MAPPWHSVRLRERGRRPPLYERVRPSPIGGRRTGGFCSQRPKYVFCRNPSCPTWSAGWKSHRGERRPYANWRARDSRRAPRVTVRRSGVPLTSRRTSLCEEFGHWAPYVAWPLRSGQPSFSRHRVCDARSWALLSSLESHLRLTTLYIHKHALQTRLR